MGMTRAKELLYFTAADYYGEGKREKRLSPFIFEALGDRVVSSEQRLESGEQLTFLDYKPIKESAVSRKLAPIHIDYLSYSQIETFNICPLHYKLRYIYKVPTPPSASQSFGITMHATLKSFYETIMSDPTSYKTSRGLEALILNLLEKSWIREGYTSKKHEHDFLEKGKLYLAGFLKEGFDPKNLPETLEQPFTVPLGNLKIGGKIDRVDIFKDRTIEIIDYKTGATIPSQSDVDKNLQLSFYALAATKIPFAPYDKKPKQVKLSLYFLDSQEKISTTRTAKQLEEAIEEIFKVREEIEKSDFKCSGHMFCQNICEYSLFCKSDV